MVKLGLREWDPARGMDSDEERALYLDYALEDDFPPLILRILGDIARSKGMEKKALEAGLHPEYLIVGSQFREEPDLSTFLAIVKALGLRLHAGAA